MKRAASPAPTNQHSSSSSSKKHKHGMDAAVMQLANTFCELFKAPAGHANAIMPIMQAHQEMLKVAISSNLPAHSCKVTPSNRLISGTEVVDFPDQSYPRQDIVKTIVSEIYTEKMVEDAHSYVEDEGRWDYSHSPTHRDVEQLMDASDVIQVVFRATITGGERILNHPTSGAPEVGVVGIPSCANDSKRHIIVPIPDGEDYTWFSSEAGKNEVYKALNEVYVWINTTKICTTQINTPAVYLHIITRYGGHYESMHRWQTESMREYELKRDQAMQAQIEPPFVMYCGRPAISGQSICGKCSLTQSMLSSGF